MHRSALATVLATSLAIAGCMGDDPVRPDDTPALNPRNSQSQGLARITPVGDPIWRPVDFHLFTAPIGTAATGFAEFGELIQALLPPPEHIPIPPLFGVGPGAPHAPPYDQELAEGVAANGLVDRHSFPASSFSAEAGNGVYLVTMIVPEPGVTGRSPDFASGPIVPNSLFPITVNGIATRNGETFDPILVQGLEIPPLNESVAPQFAGVEGHSHIPLFIADNQFFGPANTPPEGRYRYEIAMRDQAGNGWDITAQFVVRKKG